MVRRGPRAALVLIAIAVSACGPGEDYADPAIHRQGETTIAQGGSGDTGYRIQAYRDPGDQLCVDVRHANGNSSVSCSLGDGGVNVSTHNFPEPVGDLVVASGPEATERFVLTIGERSTEHEPSPPTLGVTFLVAPIRGDDPQLDVEAFGADGTSLGACPDVWWVPPGDPRAPDVYTQAPCR